MLYVLCDLSIDAARPVDEQKRPLDFEVVYDTYYVGVSTYHFSKSS